MKPVLRKILPSSDHIQRLCILNLLIKAKKWSSMNSWADRISDLLGQRQLNEMDMSHSLISRLINSWELLLRTYQKTSNTLTWGMWKPLSFLSSLTSRKTVSSSLHMQILTCQKTLVMIISVLGRWSLIITATLLWVATEAFSKEGNTTKNESRHLLFWHKKLKSSVPNLQFVQL